MRNAVILVDKSEGITSFDCLGKIKRTIDRKTGHCGTLDKFAHGLMIVLCGGYTHLVPLFMGLDKTYEAVIEFGKETSTLDPEGETVAEAPVPSIETIRKSMEGLVGQIMQVPPVYSALHVNGKRSYELVRSGADVELKARPVTIYSAEILSWESPFLKVRLHVSKGTYIRSWARDLGASCSSRAYLVSLYRTEIGPYSVQESVRWDDLEALAKADDGLTLVRRLGICTEIALSDAESVRLSHGLVVDSLKTRIADRCLSEDKSIALLTSEGRLACIYDAKAMKIMQVLL